MSLTEQMRDLPMTWKDWVTALGLTLTLGAVMLKGGQMIERLDATNRQLADLSAQLSALRAEHVATQRDITSLRGRDELHDEQIGGLRKDVDRLTTKGSR